MTTAARTVERTITRVRAEVHRHDGDPIVLANKGSTGHGHGSAAAVVGATETMKLGMDPATFTVDLKEGALNIQEEIQAGDWVVLTWEVNGEAHFGQLGQILVVAETRTVEGETGAPDATFTLHCENFGRVFNRTTIWFDDYTNYKNNAGGQILGQRMGWVPGGSPDTIVGRLALAWLAVEDAETRATIGTSWRWPASLAYLGDHFIDGLLYRVGENQPFSLAEYGISTANPPNAHAIEDLVRQRLTRRIGLGHNLRGESFDEIQLWQPNPGTVLRALMSEWCNPILNELYFDLETEKTGVLGSLPDTPFPTLRIRERPFVVAGEGRNRGMKSPWFRLPTTYLTRGDIVGGTTSSNDAERLNLFLLYATQTGMTNYDHYVAYPPSYDEESIDRHGLRKWEQSTRFSAVANGQASWLEEINDWHHLVKSWYSRNHRWLSGTLEVPRILKTRIGQRLVVGHEGDPKREQYYVESVTRSWRYPSSARTSLGVTRGFKGSDIDLVIAVEEAASKYQRRVPPQTFDANSYDVADLGSVDVPEVVP
jgi:hypothetical protein